MSWRDLPITDKQGSTIDTIEVYTKHRFKGDTRGEASDFIGAHIEESMQASREYHEELRRAGGNTRLILDDGKGNDNDIYNDDMWRGYEY